MQHDSNPQNIQTEIRTEHHLNFEQEMSINLNDLRWNAELDMYENELTQLCWLTWVTCLEHKLKLKNHCMINKTWFMKNTPVSNLIQHAENIYKTEVIAQNSKIKFGTDDNQTWWAHEVPFFGTVQMERIEEHGFVEWDIVLNDCWQGPFESKERCIHHLEECIKEKRDEDVEC